MNYSPILIVAGEPNSIFLEIFFKSIKLNKFKSPIILITSEKLLKRQMVKLKFKKKIRLLKPEKLKNYTLNNNSINLINIKYQQKKVFEKISNKSNKFINDSFSLAFKIIKKEKIFKFINGPISKKNFLNKKYMGITEFVTQKFNSKKSCMLIYNKNLSVCPVTTHLPLRSVTKKINKNLILEKVKLINEFYKKQFKIKPQIAILGLNPHCESIYKFNEDEKIIKPAVNYLKKKKYLVSGPHSADTIFLNQNRKKYDVILGMYHDQVLTPIKTLFEYDAINITLGLPFIRVSPDHGPNQTMVGKNLSNPLSLIRAINFLDKN
tara:strand:- start:107 stop:1072 length:966 start_codon:yes stop_codon:yes gene_type:complete